MGGTGDVSDVGGVCEMGVIAFVTISFANKVTGKSSNM